MVALPASQQSYKKVVGRMGSRPLYAIGGIGGIHVIAAGTEVLGMGSHPALAKLIARKNHRDVEFDDLEKSEQVDPRFFAGILADWEHNTAEARRLQGFE